MNMSLVTSGALAIALVGGGAGGYALHGSPHSSSSAGGTQLDSIAAQADATAHNTQDVSFAQDMVEHHQQAVVMATMAATRSTNAQVLALATTIEGAQSPEIQKMTSWLTAWGAPVTPPASTSGTNGMASDSMDMGGGSGVSGMMSDADMASLGALHGAAFDTMFLNMMTQHHDGAISMAQQELKGGRYGDSLALAASIVVSQQAQVHQMNHLLSE